MNRNECSNCLVHGWKQPDSETSLLTCEKCELIKYCSKECQAEHWTKVHKLHCKHFADPAKNEPWQHREKDCSLCLKAAEVGETNLTKADNPNYECVFKVQFPQSLLHPHPFPITGQEGDIQEKGIIVLWQLVRKFELIHPQVAQSCHEEFWKLKSAFIKRRVAIWRNRKTYPKPESNSFSKRLQEKLYALDDKMKMMANTEDSFHLWGIVMLVQQMVFNVDLINNSKFLKDPLANLPDDIKKLVSKGIGIENTTKYLTMVSKVQEALSTQVIPYKDVLKIVGGGSLKQNCSLCYKKVDISSDNITVCCSTLLLGKYFCTRQDCRAKQAAVIDDQRRLDASLKIMCMVREVNMCDFCFKRTPVKQVGSAMSDIHRCSHCKTVMYCGQDCLYQDDQVHVKACQEDKEGRKRKPGGSARRRAAREEIERFDQMDNMSQIFSEVLGKFKLKNASMEQENK